MSRDKSLKSKAGLARHRNVLTRAERVGRLQDLGQWKDESTAVGMPKVAHRKASVGKKGKSKKQEAEAEKDKEEEKKS